MNSSIMPAALWTLLWLNFRGFLRRIGRQAKSPRGILFFLIGLCVIGSWVGSSIFSSRHLPPPDPDAALAAAPAAIFLLCMLNLFTSAGERAVTFTPAEVDFLFPGPFTRRSLLIYRLIKTGLGTILSALIFATVLGKFGGTFVFRFAGVWLLFQFTQLLAMSLALLQTIFGERFVASTRWWIVIALVAAAGLAAAEIFRNNRTINLSLLTQARDTIAGTIVLAPFTVFARVLLARRLFPDFLVSAAIALLIDVAMAVLVIGLDANYLETSAAASARRYDRIARVRRSGLAGMARPTSAKIKLPMLPWIAGTGPIVWRQMTTAVRTARTLLIVLAVIAVGIGVLLGKSSDERASIGLMIGIGVWLNLFLSQLLKFDFRGDLDHLDVLKSLPLRPTAVAAAQLVAPAMVLSAVQLLFLGALTAAGATQFPPGLIAATTVFVVPLNVLTIAADNLMFLLFPYRPTAAVAGDMGLIGRQTIVFSCRFLLLLAVAGFAAGIGASVWFMTDQSLPAAAVAAWFPLVIAIALLVWLIGLAFQRFDPSVSTPP